MTKKEDVIFLNQLVRTLEEAELKLAEAYDEKNYESFNNMKKLIIQIQKKIQELLNEWRIKKNNFRKKEDS